MKAIAMRPRKRGVASITIRLGAALVAGLPFLGDLLADAAGLQGLGGRVEAACAQVPQIATGLNYKTLGSNKLYMVPETPPGWKASDSRPALVFFYGGSWAKRCWVGDSMHTRYMRDDLGMVVFRVDYRLLGQGGQDSIWRDGRSAIRFVRKNAKDWGVDPNRIVAMGSSAGAEIAFASAMYQDRDEPNEDRSISAVPNAVLGMVPALSGSDLPGLTDAMPPTLMMCGATDDFWYTGNNAASSWHYAARQWNAEVKLKVFAGDGHGFPYTPAGIDSVHRWSKSFLESYALLGNRASTAAGYRVRITSPSAGKAVANGQVKLTAQAVDSTGGMAVQAKSVEFFADTATTPIAVDNEAPFEATVNLSEDYHKVFARAVFASGEKKRSSKVGFIVGSAAVPAVIGVKKAGQPGPSDMALADYLKQKGYKTSYVDLSLSGGPVAHAALFLMTNNINNVPFFKYLNIPFINSWGRSFYGSGMVSDSVLAFGGMDTLNIFAKAAGHPSVGGKSGKVAVQTGSFTTVRVPASAFKLAHIPGDTDKVVMAAWEAGSWLPAAYTAASYPAASRRMLYYSVDVNKMNATGKALFDSALYWLTGSEARLPVTSRLRLAREGFAADGNGKVTAPGSARLRIRSARGAAPVRADGRDLVPVFPR